MQSSTSIITPSYFACFRAFSADSEWNILFKSPLEIRIGSVSEVPEVVEFAESASRSGRWAVLALAYEAAPAFEPALQVHLEKNKRQPAVWSAIFDPEQVAAPPEPAEGRTGEYQVDEWQPGVSQTGYERAIREIHRYIAAGHTYQVNYTFPLLSHFKGNAEAWFNQLWNAQQAEYCALLNLPDRLFLSLSPELFFRRDNRTLLTTRPMKGTMPRGRFPAEDRERRQELLTSAKNRAENVMITDLIRNDLGRVAKPGTVEVSKLFEIEQFKTVWQMTSTVQALIEAEIRLTDIFAALFPCGSITGAPKIRTMEIINHLEPCPRDIYTGAIGFLRPGGDCIFNVPIRTVALNKQTQQARFGVGGGITTDSTAKGEFEECILKALFLTCPPKKFALLETILLENGQCFLLKQHLQRLKQSAAYFRFPYERKKPVQQLQELKKQHPEGQWKVRLLVESNGNITTEINPLPEPENHDRPLQLQLAGSPVDSNDVFLFHKTTNREVYEKARQERPNCDEVILFNEKGEITETCIYNLAIEKNGIKWTPPIESGLLAGTFRKELLSQKEIREKILYPHDLEQADIVWLFNSVRKWRLGALT